MKFVVRGFLTFLSILSALSAQEVLGAMTVNSGEAVYDGKKIVLVGDVVVQHSLGKISARRLSLLPSSDKKINSKFSSLEISDTVSIELKEGGQLRCEKGEVDYGKMQGTFLGSDEHPDVVFYNKGEETEIAHAARAPFEVKSSQMTFDLSCEAGGDADSSKTHISQIKANQNVRVGYNQDYLLLADHALYQRLPQAKNSSREGLLTLSVDEGHPFCRMNNLNGDSLQAKSIEVNTVDQTILFHQSEGKLLMNKEKQPLQTLEFKARELAWDDRTHMFILRGEVDISQNGSLHVQTDGEISIAQTQLEGKRILRCIQSPENTQILYTDAKGVAHRINCPGPLTIDHEKHEMRLERAAGTSGEENEKGQVTIEDVLGDMYADRVRLSYHWKEGRMEPENIILEGNVRLINRFDGHVDESGSILHYAMADIVDYSPTKQEMKLECLNKNRVLFFDKVNNIQMSAPSLRVSQDGGSGKELIQGEGDVRFTFIEKEIAQLKNRFKLCDSSQEGFENGK